jgi:3-isopropylmalate/(R)-2-methylmalate dehydratase small subunit
MSIYIGTAHVFGDNVDTDRIIPGKYTKTLDLANLATHVLEDVDPNFSSRVRPGDIVVAGDNFGAGSSREQAPLALQAAGVAVVVANFFARIFYRNAINIGLPVVEVGRHEIQTGHEVEVDLGGGWVKDRTSGQRYMATQMPEVMVDILNAGGLVNYLREHGNYG